MKHWYKSCKWANDTRQPYTEIWHWKWLVSVKISDYYYYCYYYYYHHHHHHHHYHHHHHQFIKSWTIKAWLKTEHGRIFPEQKGIMIYFSLNLPHYLVLDIYGHIYHHRNLYFIISEFPVFLRPKHVILKRSSNIT